MTKLAEGTIAERIGGVKERIVAKRGEFADLRESEASALADDKPTEVIVRQRRKVESELESLELLLDELRRRLPAEEAPLLKAGLADAMAAENLAFEAKKTAFAAFETASAAEKAALAKKDEAHYRWSHAVNQSAAAEDRLRAHAAAHPHLYGEDD